MFKNVKDDNKVKVALATLMCNIAHADNKITNLERDNVYSFFQHEFELSTQETKSLFAPLLEQTSVLDKEVEIITQALVDNMKLKAILLTHLNNLIICDGCKDIEYDVFSEIKNRFLS